MSSHRHSQCHTDVPAALLVAADSPECGSGSCVCETQVPTAGRAVSFPLSPSGRSDEETSTSTSYFSGALRLNDVEAVPFYNTCVLWLFSAWFSRLNSSERNDARVVVYPRYMSEKAVWKTQDQSSRELRWCSEKQTKILKKDQETHVVLSDELHQDVSDQRLPVFSRQSLLQGVSEEQMSLQQLLHKLQIRLTGSQTQRRKLRAKRRLFRFCSPDLSSLCLIMLTY